MASIAAVGVVAVQSVAVVSELPWVIGVNELLSDMLADGVRGDGVLFESECGDDVLDVERLAVDFLCNAVGNIMQVTAVDVFASEQIRGEVHCISGIQRWNVSLVQIIDCGSGDSGGGEFGQNVVDTDGSCEDDAEAGVFNAEAADGIEHLCGDRESFVAADAVEHPGDFIPEEHEFFCLTGFVEVSDGRVEQLFPCAAFEVDVIGFVVFEPSLYEVFSASGGAEELLNVVVDEFSKFECRVDFFKVVEDGFPAGFWLLQHFAKDLRFACSSFAGLEDGLGLEGLPEEFDEVVASVDVLWLEVSAGVGFHGSGLWDVVFCVEAVGVAGVLLWELWGSVCSVSIVKCVLCEICFVREAAGLAPAGASGGGGGGGGGGGRMGAASGFGAERLDFFQLVSGGRSGVHCHIAAVEWDDGTGDPGGGIGSQQQSDAADVIGLSQSIGGDAFEEAGFELWVVGHASLEAGVDDLSGCHAVDSDTPVGPFGAEFACHLDDSAHGHAVGDVSATECGAAGEGPDIHDGS